MDRRVWIEGLWVSLLGGLGLGSCASPRALKAHASPMLADQLISAPRLGHLQLPPAPGETTAPILTAILSSPDLPWIACSGDDYWIRWIDPKDQRIVEAELAVVRVESGMEQLLAEQPEVVVEVHDQLKLMLDLFKTQFVSVLDLDIPQRAEGDND